MISNGTVWQVTMAPHTSANPSGLGLRPLFEDLSRFLVPEQKIQMCKWDLHAQGKLLHFCLNLSIGGFAEGFRYLCYDTEQMKVFEYVPVENRQVFPPTYISEKVTRLLIAETLDVFYQPFPAFVIIVMLF